MAPEHQGTLDPAADAPATAPASRPTAAPGPPAPAETGAVVELLKLAAPTVVTMTSYTVMQFVDSWMVSRIDGDPIYVGALGHGGMAAWVPISVMFGLLGVINTYVSQNLGAGRPERAPAYAWNGLWLAAIASIALLPFAAVMPLFFEALGHTERQIALQTTYGRILLYGAFLTIGRNAISQYFYGMHRPWIILVAGLAGNAGNLLANYLLIYGNHGFPRLEIAGAAIGTLIGSGIELAIPLAVFLSPLYNRLYATRRAWRPSAARIADLLRIGWAPALMFGNEMICWSLFMVGMVGRFGELHSTAGWIAHRWMSLSFMPAVGLSVAVTATVGRCIGAGRPDLAARRAWIGLAVALAYMGTCGVAFILFRAPMTRLFINERTPPEAVDEVVRVGSLFLIAVATFQLFDAVAMIISGALRGAGDTVWVGVATLGLSWTIIVGGGYLAITAFPALGSLGPWIAASAYIIILSLVILGRFLTGRWKEIQLVRKG